MPSQEDMIAEGQITETEDRLRRAQKDFIIVTLDVGLAEGKSYGELAEKILKGLEL